MNANRLPTKPPEQDPDRRTHQAQVKQAIVEGQAFALTYLLARLRNRQPYDNYCVPDSLAEFEFSVKGVLRLELLRNETRSAFAGWRRLFGSNTKANELSSWRSRVAVKAFANLTGARAYVEADPLLAWSGRRFPWKDVLPEDEWYVLFQVQDVWIENGRKRWSELLDTFLLEHSRVLQLIPPLFDVLPPVKADKGGKPK